MKSKLKKLLRPFLFTVGGALAGLGYYYVVGCSTGSCAITSNPIITMIYTVLTYSNSLRFSYIELHMQFLNIFNHPCCF